MFQTISNFMRVRDIRNKIIFTLINVNRFSYRNIHPGTKR